MPLPDYVRPEMTAEDSLRMLSAACTIWSATDDADVKLNYDYIESLDEHRMWVYLYEKDSNPRKTSLHLLITKRPQDPTSFGVLVSHIGVSNSRVCHADPRVQSTIRSMYIKAVAHYRVRADSVARDSIDIELAAIEALRDRVKGGTK